jgi:mycothiol synthase
MITVEFRDEFSPEEAEELAAMIADAMAHDEEAGFSTATPNSDADDDGEIAVFQMVARLNPGMHGSPDSPLVAFLRLDVDRDGAAIAQMLVRRGYRSLGIGTLLVEQLCELDGPGFAGTGAKRITSWAHGSHPAADRMARRFGAEEGRSRWKLMRGEEVRYVAPEDKPAVLAARRDGFVHEHTDVCYVWPVPVPSPRS